MEVEFATWLRLRTPKRQVSYHKLCMQVRISRKRIMESAMKVFEMYGSSRAVLEIEYFNEVGTGLGPTLEFYTMLSHDFQRRGLKLWRGDEEKLSSTASGVTASSCILHASPVCTAMSMHLSDA